MEETSNNKVRSPVWPDLIDNNSSLKAAKGGVNGGGLLIASLLIGLVFVIYTGDYHLFNASDLRSFYISQTVSIAIVAFLTLRVFTGRGRFASILLLIWIVLEVALKLASGQLNIGWGIMWSFAILSLLHSVRGSWALRGFRRTTTGAA